MTSRSLHCMYRLRSFLFLFWFHTCNISVSVSRLWLLYLCTASPTCDLSFFCVDLTLVIFLFLSPAYDFSISALHLPLSIFLFLFRSHTCNLSVSISHLWHLYLCTACPACDRSCFCFYLTLVIFLPLMTSLSLHCISRLRSSILLFLISHA